MAASRSLKRFQAKWTPVLVKKTREYKNLEIFHVSAKREKAQNGQHEKRRAQRPAVLPLTRATYHLKSHSQFLLHNDKASTRYFTARRVCAKLPCLADNKPGGMK